MDTRRIKVFLGYRYDYGKTQTGPRQLLYDDVDTMSKLSLVALVREVLVRVLRNDMQGYLKLPGRNFFNQAVMVCYLKFNSGLGTHQDSKSLFQRPIISIRLLADAALSFNRVGRECRRTPQSFSVPQSVGTVTLLERFAADYATHCVLKKDLKVPSLSIVFRGVQQSAVEAMRSSQV
ncbi:hypothetical protein SARC_02073 [Sphaeroforma arctica JP610]|uniref:Alpha-ketoglutarate-dependent dioxygenase AlkB-like domain-containing protein n=1 Tax=Sphaeroforma arctica JP610 TaxID=667725 RepID=A0A0L0GA32_9EUKA|nr:hypothetical protein SARC_02073 [Sphaeroforma arctica JP610]KNC85769.1 hypothetical protein SARC_02073 [Sphaeroforma arctica JP610]|eukprot:XP_014159671.1 hypothetical protein SARC_02073 [Sphaeroforma arctica JP610]